MHNNSFHIYGISIIDIDATSNWKLEKIILEIPLFYLSYTYQKEHSRDENGIRIPKHLPHRVKVVELTSID